MRAGWVSGVSAYLLWGLFPLFWPLLEPAGAIEVLAHRMIWSLVVMVLVLSVLRRWRELRTASARTWGMVVAAALLITVNWGFYIWAVTTGRVLDAALGYFINPLVSVLLGVLVFRERLRPATWTAVGIGALAVMVISVGGGRFPWVAFVLALSFGLYGLVKKVIRLEPAASLTAEGLVLLVPATAYLTVLQATGHGTFTDHGAGHTLLLISAGVVTVVPLLLFTAAARALPLSVVGFLQYLTPVVQFLLGVFWAHEHMPVGRWVGFVLVWLALVVLTVEGLARRRRAAADRRAVAARPVEDPLSL
ncbi:EamA family transporter RarD [Nakamurella endophytica]|uniref:Protein RarD n=1 Tax=Nakamurella endophytica TaxID=1748367 RepID=A0A917WGQ0_9ACTN|nr:EamA family transporter RarD [Nakamurella endophytica]GGM03691.1 protein RarD [Nakamurella endophytica]